MTSAGGFLDFFVLEASGYIERLDALMQRAAEGTPDGEALQRTGRALRGAAMMARLPAFAELAAAVEGVGRAARDGVVQWTPSLRAAMVAAVDDLKILVRAARTWGEAETQRAETRQHELASFAPPTRRRRAAASARPSYLVGETSNIAAGLELLATRPDNRAAAGSVLSRVRALRGVAGIKDLPPLPEVVEAAEDAARPLELGRPRLSPDRVALLRAAAGLLRRIADALRDGRSTSEPSAEYEKFVAASEALERTGDDAARIVPIASMFYEDQGPHVVSRAPNPPTTPDQRFRMEVVSLAEHLKGVVAMVRATPDPLERERTRRELRRALRAIQQSAVSFGEQNVADLIAMHANVADRVDEKSLATIERIVQTIAYPDAPVSASAPTPIAGTRAVPERTPARSPAVRMTPAARMTPVNPFTPTGSTTPVRPAPRAVPMTPSRPSTPPASLESVAPVRVPTPVTGMQPLSPADPTPAIDSSPFALPEVEVPPDEHVESLDEGIAALDAFTSHPFAEPVPVDAAVVPIEALLYRGRSAVERAIELRQQIEDAGGRPSSDQLGELFDLLDLALEE